MSRKGNCLDNSPMENFFSLLKQEMYHGVEAVSYDTLKERIERYIDYYNHRRIKTKLSGLIFNYINSNFWGSLHFINLELFFF